jgi:heat-inducible transcriptional repressor
MSDLTSRQTKILKHVIEEYIDTAEPVGSVSLDRKYNLGVSPATLRNEMAELIKLGYLKQPHTSAGRVPTPMALRLFVNSLMQPKNLSVTDEVKIKEKVWDFRNEYEKALREATRELADQTKSLAVAMDSDGDLYYAGTANILDMPEFFDIDLTKHVLSLLDHVENLDKIWARADGLEDLQVLMAEELGNDFLAPCAVVFARFGAGKKHQGTIGVFGPCRQNYPRLIPTVRYFGGLMDEMMGNWR